MKKLLLTSGILSIIAATLIYSPLDATAVVSSTVGVTLNYDYCYRTLEPHGIWYNTYNYGMAWRPTNIPANWSPYTRGRWEAFDNGWLWVSDFSWGWLPFHYGRWYWDSHWGWSWVPGYDWAPAWVSWYTTDSYVGWTPMPPVSYGASYIVPPSSWFFVSVGNFVSPALWSYSVPYYHVNTTICRPYTLVNNYYYIDDCYYYRPRGWCSWYGPRVHVIERHVHRHIHRYNIRNVYKVKNHNRVRDNVIEVYRPNARVEKEIRPQFEKERDTIREQALREKREERSIPRENNDTSPQRIERNELRRKEAEQREERGGGIVKEREERGGGIVKEREERGGGIVKEREERGGGIVKEREERGGGIIKEREEPKNGARTERVTPVERSKHSHIREKKEVTKPRIQVPKPIERPTPQPPKRTIRQPQKVTPRARVPQKRTPRVQTPQRQAPRPQQQQPQPQPQSYRAPARPSAASQPTSRVSSRTPQRQAPRSRPQSNRASARPSAASQPTSRASSPTQAQPIEASRRMR